MVLVNQNSAFGSPKLLCTGCPPFDRGSAEPRQTSCIPLRALNFLMGMGTITKFAIHGRNNFRDISKYACPLLHRGLGLFGNQAKHALVEGNEFDVLLLQQVLYLRRPWGGQLMPFFPQVNAKQRYRSGLMETLGNI